MLFVENTILRVVIFLRFYLIIFEDSLGIVFEVINRLSTKQNVQKLGFYYNFNILNNIPMDVDGFYKYL